MKKKDFLIAAVVLLLAGILALVFRFAGGDPGGSVQVKVDGRVAGTYALVEEQRVPFDTKYGHNTLVIEGGKAHIEDADCPDHYCEQQRVLLRLCPESACQTGPSLELSSRLEAGGCAVRASPGVWAP